MPRLTSPAGTLGPALPQELLSGLSPVRSSRRSGAVPPRARPPRGGGAVAPRVTRPPGAAPPHHTRGQRGRSLCPGARLPSLFSPQPGLRRVKARIRFPASSIKISARKLRREREPGVRWRARPWGHAGTRGGRTSRWSLGTVAARPFQLREKSFLPPEVSPRQRRGLPGSARGRVPSALVPPGQSGKRCLPSLPWLRDICPGRTPQRARGAGWEGAGLYPRGTPEPPETPGRGAGGE